MVESLIKLLAGQVLTSRPALERPITQAKYGLLGALAVGLVSAAAALTLGGALYVWLAALGVHQALSLLVVGALLVITAFAIWGVSRRMMEREIRYQEIRAEIEAQQTAPAAGADLLIMVSSLLQETAKGFAEGLTTPKPGGDRHTSTGARDTEESQ
ncbi:hypothetical protein [Kordiimonas sp.]|uniref:hypothetical protein n=1 Tax=Kordiimonas sp. TaxID=1970157 RepID=UPI003A95BB22